MSLCSAVSTPSYHFSKHAHHLRLQFMRNDKPCLAQSVYDTWLSIFSQALGADEVHIDQCQAPTYTQQTDPNENDKKVTEEV